MNFTEEQKKLQVRMAKNGMNREVVRDCPYISETDKAMLKNLLQDDIDAMYNECKKGFTNNGASKLYKRLGNTTLGIKVQRDNEFSQLKEEVQAYKMEYFVTQYQDTAFKLSVCPIAYNYRDKKADKNGHKRHLVIVPHAVELICLDDEIRNAERAIVYRTDIHNMNLFDVQINVDSLKACKAYAEKHKLWDVIDHHGNCGYFLNLITGKLDAMILDYAL